ncbi:sugar ABC transporter substrate-binding protein [Couchioplanes caeruleus]|uniref:Sugar ABC transporter substrate-binding protein n=2 Tax=Couchioplanes caeruleus TaxID=56438 RepID=A0A1K0H2R0_9ACTN|nr:substrate-binding domain-containing protein [Couchioplanes caeruleus]OJF11209.1 sugar ABC transporter substrate-binding protein [Couchioplanes caeruleus subsp. caeruleus]OJF15987.1 sugar ABC transporter substrate-binding protein [Couchioplanes caeruleus subsp. caeruleus]ROP27843.1 monosaccharide ABC transporter substrate-binding protein (CUT2 family) [Couchioplanes caeruleus]
MARAALALAAAGVLAAGVAACDGDGGDDDRTVGRVGVILPDTKSSARWATADPRFLREAFARAGVTADIQNAQGDKSQFQTIADGMISSGVRVLMIVNLDSGTGKAVLDKAKRAGIATIDYDRLTLSGGADYYVSFDNVAVGRLQGEGLVKCLTDRKRIRPVVAELNGSPTDNNSTLFKQGYDSVLQPKFDSGEYVKGPDQSVSDWDNAQAGTMFEQMLTQRRDIKGVLAANDGIANAAIGVLRKYRLHGDVLVTGQDATVQGLRNILAGDQCMTVYKDIQKEAAEATAVAVALARGQRPTTATDVVTDPETGRNVPSILLTPKAVTRDTIPAVIAEGFVTRQELCTAEYAAACAAAGIG